jgi:hypothetical protein
MAETIATKDVRVRYHAGRMRQVIAGQPVPANLVAGYKEQVPDEEPKKAKAEAAPEVVKAEAGPELHKTPRRKDAE